MRSRRFIFAAALLLVALALVGAVSLAAGSHSPDENGALLTWEEAVAIGHPSVRDFRKPPGMRYCADVNFGFPGLRPDDAPPPTTGPVCFVRPEEQGIMLARVPNTAHSSTFKGSADVPRTDPIISRMAEASSKP